jgi:hypothetical protein
MILRDKITTIYDLQKSILHMKNVKLAKNAKISKKISHLINEKMSNIKIKFIK